MTKSCEVCERVYLHEDKVNRISDGSSKISRLAIQLLADFGSCVHCSGKFLG